MSLYEELKAAGVQVEHHNSDLYFPYTQLTHEILLKHQQEAKHVRTFTDDIDRNLWYEVPFAYLPYW